MEFAKNLMKKYGWKEGEGLGKNNNGISVPLRPKLKFDTAGLGEDKAAEFKNHWWERVFNDAANNINVHKSGENVEIGVKNEDSVEITTKGYSLKKLKNNRGQGKYKYFLKKSVLNGLKEKSEVSEGSEPEEVEDFPKYKSLTDEELFAACGGRTAHKGARHGLNSSGKLSRIEKQERELLEKLQNNEQNEGDWMVVKSKKKRKREESQVDNNSNLKDILFTTEYHVKSKKKKKREKQLDNELSAVLNCAEIATEGEASKSAETTPISSHKKKRGKRKQIACLENSESSNSISLDEEISNGNQSQVASFQSKKGKKEIREDAAEDIAHDACNFLKSDEIKVEKSSKQKRRKSKKGIENFVN